jgi:hypothetical protein
VLRKLRLQLRRQPLHLFLERFPVVLHLRRADVASGREDVVVGADVVEGGGFAEAGNIFIFLLAILIPAPGVVGARDLGDVVFGQFTVDAVNHRSHLPGVYEQRFTAPVAEAPVTFVAGDEPQADGNLRGVEQLAGQGDHAIHQVGLNDGIANLALAGLVGGHRTVRQDKSGHARGGQMIDEVLHLGEVGIGDWRHAVLPAAVVFEQVAAPIGVVEGRIGKDVVGLEVGVQVVVEAVGMFRAEVALDAANRQVHLRQPPGGVVGFLAVDRDVADAPAVGFDEALGLDEHPAGAATGVEGATFVGGEHRHEQPDDAVGGIELAALFALRAGELGEEVFVDAPQDVAGAVGGVAQADVGDEVNELAEALLVEARVGVVLG